MIWKEVKRRRIAREINRHRERERQRDKEREMEM